MVVHTECTLGIDKLDAKVPFPSLNQMNYRF